MEKPDLSKVKDKAILEYIEHLEKINSKPEAKMYVAMDEQLEKISTAIRGLYIDITSEKSDAEFDRFIKFSTESKKISENLEYFRKILKPEEIDKVKKIEGASVEQYVFNPDNEVRD